MRDTRGRYGFHRRVAVAGLLAFIAAACAADEALEFPEARPEAAPGGTLRIGINEPLSIDPQATDALEPGQALIVSTICDTLITLDPVTGEARGGIAESWQISDRGQRLNVRLRRGVRFHNGDEVMAEDVVFALSRIAERDFASPVASILRPVDGYDRLQGAPEVDDDRQGLQLSGLRVVEPFSFEVALTTELSDFFKVLSHPATAPVPKQEVEEDPDAFSRQPVCAGPYRMRGPWNRGDPSIRVERFTDYHGQNLAHTRGGIGYPDEIEFRFYEDRDAQVVAFEAGEVDVAHAPQERLAELRRFGDALVPATTPTLEYIGLPTTQAPFDQRGVRIALSQALDRNRIVDDVYGGLRRPAHGILPPSLGSVHRDDACGDHAPPRSDIEAARESLRRAGVDLEGLTVEFSFNDEFGHERLVAEVARQWEAAFGMRAEPVPVGWDAYLARGLGQPGFEGPFRMSWAPQYQAPSRYLAPLFHSASIQQDNFARFSDPNFDERLEKDAARAVAEEDRMESFQVLENTLCGEMPVIPVAYGARLYLVNPETVGSAPQTWSSIATGMIMPRELFIAG